MDGQEHVSFYHVIQHKVDGYLQHINLSSRDVIQYVSIFGIGFLIGVLFKRYGAMIMSWLIGIVLLCLVLHYFDLIVINKLNIKILLHLDHVHTLDDFIVEIQQRTHAYRVESVIAIVAIILGFKLG